MTPEERETLLAVMERIVPADDFPGATDAGAIDYAEWVNRQPWFQSVYPRFAAGLGLLDSLALGLWGRPFPRCRAEEQDVVLQRLQAIPHPAVQRFFGMVVKMTLAGFLCSPDYGGNRGRVGWSYIGFHAPSWEMT